MKAFSYSRALEVLRKANLLLEEVGSPSDRDGLSVENLTSDSRRVTSGTLFVAIAGEKSDGHVFLGSAIENGAIALIGEQPLAGFGVPYLRVKSSRQALALLAAEKVGQPSLHMKVIGITGTSGKTTSSYLIESILQAAGERVGVIGTVNFRFEGEILPSTHTTPGPVELQQLLAQMRQKGCTAVVMEVSSHALKQARTAGIAFDAMVFTNLSPEHLDYHPDMEDYFASKRLLFTEYAEYSVSQGKSPVMVVPLDQDWGERLFSDIQKLPTVKVGSAKCVTVHADAHDPSVATWVGGSLNVELRGTSGRLLDRLHVDCPLTGKFNVSNILGAIAATSALSYSDPVLEKGLSSLSGVPGRMEKIVSSDPRSPHVWVDYAHKPDALEKVLLTLRNLRDEVSPQGKLICVFGCGGDRDRQKRPKMGEISVRLSDRVYVTSDNPRTEDPASITQEILRGIPESAKSKVTLELDRRLAIGKAIRDADSMDLIVIAGKGHEDYQILRDPSDPTGTRTIQIHFDDREEVRAHLSHSN
jgi:UDP-N-acetylmuramoyl-L-alanyl-D-glutamate--2,6-diaminopimelate ligase